MDFLKWARYHWDRVAAAVLVGLGLLALLLGYLGVSGTVYPAEQLPYMISGGIVGLFCLGTAALLYLSADMRDEWRKLDSIDGSLKALTGLTTRGPDDDSTEVAASDGPDIVSDAPSRDVVTRARASTKSSSQADSNGSKPRAAARKRTQSRSTGQRAGTTRS
ncbi:MAG: hypothetical protein ABR498_07060 [Candidatus Dormibacteria bacterium]